jgi:hypothetical protein
LPSGKTRRVVSLSRRPNRVILAHAFETHVGAGVDALDRIPAQDISRVTLDRVNTQVRVAAEYEVST